MPQLVEVVADVAPPLAAALLGLLHPAEAVLDQVAPLPRREVVGVVEAEVAVRAHRGVRGLGEALNLHPPHLHGLPGAQVPRRPVVDRDPARPAVLGLAQRLVLGVLVLDEHPHVVEVHVAPREAERLATPHAGREREPDGDAPVVELVAVERLTERDRLLERERGPLGRARARDLDVAAGVVLGQVLLHGEVYHLNMTALSLWTPRCDMPCSSRGSA